MNIPNITWRGDSLDDVEILPDLPTELVDLLNEVNGFIVHHGAVHVRGAVKGPAWHSLRESWRGAHAFQPHYPELEATDIPFAQDQFGDQFLLREGVVWRLSAESGDTERCCADLDHFLAGLCGDIEEFFNVSLQHKLVPGQLLLAMPPFCVDGGGDISFKAISAEEAIAFHADFARQIRDVADGEKIAIKTELD